MFILVVFSIMLMILDTRVTAITRVRTALSLSLVPLQYMVSAPIRFVDTLGKIVSSHDALVRENLDLKAQQLLLRAQVQRLLAIENENNQLKALSKSSAQIHGKVLIAQLLAVDTDPFVHQVTLNKGSRHGVFIGQPVLDANGVMGKVIQVGPISSRVLLVNDPHSGVPAQDARNGVRAIAMGDSYTGKLHLVNVPQTIDIKKGDVIVTSGLGKDYPEGYPLGVVTDVIKDYGLQFSTITVEPSARLDKARQVLMVWPNRETHDYIIPATIMNPEPAPQQQQQPILDIQDSQPAGDTKSNV